MDTNDLRCFIALAEDLDPRSAASRLGVSVRALLAASTRLEQHFGRTFLDATPGGPRLTPAGCMLVVHGERLLAAAEESLRAARAAHGVVLASQ